MNLSPDPSTLLLPYRKSGAGSAAALKIGVVVDAGWDIPWVNSLVAFLRRLDGIEIQILPVDAPPSTRPSWLAGRLYEVSRKRFDPFGTMVGASDPPADTELSGCSLLIWLSRSAAPLPAEYGAFTVRFGKRHCQIPFWDEIAAGEAISEVSVFWHESGLAGGRLVRQLEVSTLHGLYVTENAAEPLIAAIRSLAGLCLELRDQSPQAREKWRALPEEPLQPPSPHQPSSLETGSFIARKLARSASLRWKSRASQGQWFVALRPNQGKSIADPEPADLAGFRDVAIPAGSSGLADPFLWQAGDRDYLFFEEIPQVSSRGRLAFMEVRHDGSHSEMCPILERNYHISYPCLVPSGNDLFLLPETSEAKRVDLYRFSRFPETLELVKPLVEGLGLVDTTPVFIDGVWYFFTTTLQPFLETFLFWSHRLDDEWNLHPASPVSSSVGNSRSAGNLFMRGGRLFRPTQDCSVRYGYAIRINEVTRLTPTEFEERSVRWVPPAWRAGLLGTHTWNESSRWQVLDGIRPVGR